MDYAKRQRPIAYCAECHRVSRDPGSIDATCNRMSTQRRKQCGGILIAAAGEANWLECPTCDATGYEGKSACGQCLGEGWLPVA